MVGKPFIIGITGNIASGKSVVRQYLENMGALAIDADMVAQRSYSAGAPAFQHVVAAFGEQILDVNHQIDRRVLAEIVFEDAKQLQKLEEIVHPHVMAALARMIAQSQAKIIAVEAIKLIETGFDQSCDLVWVVAAEDETRLQRLVKNRSMSRETASMRLLAQSPQKEKMDQADLVINTDGSFSDTYEQVRQAINMLNLSPDRPEQRFVLSNDTWLETLTLDQAYPATLLLQRNLTKPLTAEDILSLLSQQSLLGIWKVQGLIGLIFWKKGSFVSYINKIVTSKDYHKQIRKESDAEILDLIIHSSKRHFCEVLALNPNLPLNKRLIKFYEFKTLQIEAISEPMWRTFFQQFLQFDDYLAFRRLIEAELFNNLFII